MVTWNVLVRYGFQFHYEFTFSLILQILNALLKILASQPPLSVLIQWHTGWFLRKLLIFQISQGKTVNDLNFHLFNVRI